MNKKGQVGMNPFTFIMGSIIMILVGLALITSVADTKATQTDLLSVLDEQTNLVTVGCYVGGQVNESDPDCNITVSNWYPAGDWRASESQCYLSSVVVSDDTGTALTLDTDYYLYSDTGVIQLLNTTATTSLPNNLVEVDYEYCGEGYLTSSGDRSLASLWTTMMVLALIIILAIGAMKLLENSQ